MADDAMAAPLAEAPTAPVRDTAEPKSPEAPITQEDEQIAGKVATTEVNAPEGDDTAEAAVGPSAVTATTPKGKETATPKRNIGGASDKKGKGKRKSLPVLQLDCQPGEYYFARLKGHPPWPAIVCDEQMLPESLLATRPVSTARPDGTLRDDFKGTGKNAKERTFPIMFLFTNEFAWIVNTSLTPLEPKECETLPSGKMTKALQSAYQVAAEDHDLKYFKEILRTWQEEQAQIEQENRDYEERAAQEEEEKKQRAANGDPDDGKGKKKKARKSKGADEDVEMEDAEAPKSSKKRKKEDNDADNTQPKKTPKVTKINAPKTPGDSTAKKSAKPKKKLVVAPKDEEEEKPQMSEGEKLAQREKAVLYLRHRLQKGFLSRDQAPQETEMATMADFFKQLETHENLEPAIIRNTKIHKVLKAIVKLSSIPKDEEYDFKKRSSAMLDIWNRRMEADGGQVSVSAAETKGDDVVEEKEKTEEPNGVADVADAAAKSVEKKAEEPKAIDEADTVELEVNGTASHSPAAEAEKKDIEEVNGDNGVDENVPVEAAA